MVDQYRDFLNELFDSLEDDNLHFGAAIVQAILSQNVESVIAIVAMIEESIPEEERERLIDERVRLVRLL